VVRPQSLQGLVDLPRRILARAAVDLGHEEDFVAEALEGLPHAQFADAVVVVPSSVHEGDARVDGGADDPDRVGFLVDRAEVVAPDADEGDAIARAAKAAVAHVARDGLAGVLSQQGKQRGRAGGGRQRCEKRAAVHDSGQIPAMGLV